MKKNNLDKDIVNENIKIIEPNILKEKSRNRLPSELIDSDYIDSKINKTYIHKKIKELAQEDRPMEKLVFSGKGSLSDVELLAIILKTGSKEKTAISLAQEILSKYTNPEQLMQASVEELQEFKGVGLSKATTIVACLEFSSRIRRKNTIRKITVNSPESIKDYFVEKYRYEDREFFETLLFDTKNQLIGIQEISIGDLSRSLVSPREVYKFAVRRSAESIIFVHNHPSGNPEPSKDDVLVTKRLIDAGNILGITVLDHIIIGYDNYVSLKRENLI
ncbi:DNA repair protein RadC [Citroniella saccharovorans]|uniref:DNA repair protein RadC n=1 Tax=Citroniella saccharovorans TaxID=2053367 RepID=A0AAW9MYB8_9FIRM|nr:DNA repair protein RadC [Citroniella saccharovorans]MEB3429883.1 DNA repair protein RadC [Citroniella saccharovorans]